MNNSRYIIGIGAQKSGTSWLGDYLSGHPQVSMSPFKELHFFDDFNKSNEEHQGFKERRIEKLVNRANKLKFNDVLKNTKRFSDFNNLLNRHNIGDSLQNYRDYFERYAKDESVFCEISPSYAVIDHTRFEAMNSLSSDVRLIFLMRNPVDRLWSGIRMRYKKNPENIVSEFDNFIENKGLLRLSYYDKTLATVYDVFPKERVYVQFYEYLFNPDVIAQLCDFCGIDYITPNTQKRVLEGVSVPLTKSARKRIYEKIHTVYEWADAEFGDTLPASWRTDINEFG